MTSKILKYTVSKSNEIMTGKKMSAKNKINLRKSLKKSKKSKEIKKKNCKRSNIPMTQKVILF